MKTLPLANVRAEPLPVEARSKGRHFLCIRLRAQCAMFERLVLVRTTAVMHLVDMLIREELGVAQ